MIVPVKRFRSSQGVHVADLNGLDALVDVAEAYEAMVLELPSKRGTTYLVCTSDVMYRYVIPAPGATSRPRTLRPAASSDGHVAVTPPAPEPAPVPRASRARRPSGAGSRPAAD
jgi:hypothetical protein